MSNRADDLLAAARDCDAEGLEGHALRRYRALDRHLSAGGTPPEAWREGPDAPTEPIGHSEAIIRAAEIMGMDPADLTERLMAEPQRRYRIGDPDPTPDAPVDAYCSATMGPGMTFYVCTWLPGHEDDHVSGDGNRILAVWR